MTGSTKYASQHIAFCSICDNPIPLEITATDENGEAVHEECYASQTISQFRKSLYPTLKRLPAGFHYSSMQYHVYESNRTRLRFKT